MPSSVKLRAYAAAAFSLKPTPGLRPFAISRFPIFCQSCPCIRSLLSRETCSSMHLREMATRVRFVTPTYPGREECLERNRVVVLLIMGAVYKSYPTSPVRLQDRFHNCKVCV